MSKLNVKALTRNIDNALNNHAIETCTLLIKSNVFDPVAGSRDSTLDIQVNLDAILLDRSIKEDKDKRTSTETVLILIKPKLNQLPEIGDSISFGDGNYNVIGNDPISVDNEQIFVYITTLER